MERYPDKSNMDKFDILDTFQTYLDWITEKDIKVTSQDINEIVFMSGHKLLKMLWSEINKNYEAYEAENGML